MPERLLIRVCQGVTSRPEAGVPYPISHRTGSAAAIYGAELSPARRCANATTLQIRVKTSSMHQKYWKRRLLTPLFENR